MHRIQRHILSVLRYQKYARFSELKPPKVDSNLFNYHLRSLMNQGFLSKQPKGYTLALKGIIHANYLSKATQRPRPQPKIGTILFIQNADGEVLLLKSQRQPFIETWMLPSGKVHLDDESVLEAAKREAVEKLPGVSIQNLIHAGDCYVRLYYGAEIMSVFLGHVFKGFSDQTNLADGYCWYDLSNDPESSAEYFPQTKQLIYYIVNSAKGNFFFTELIEEVDVD